MNLFPWELIALLLTVAVYYYGDAPILATLLGLVAVAWWLAMRFPKTRERLLALLLGRRW